MSDDILTLPPPPADARLAYGSDPNQFLDLRAALMAKESSKPYPLVINIHGGYWRAKYNLDHAGHLAPLSPQKDWRPPISNTAASAMKAEDGPARLPISVPPINFLCKTRSGTTWTRKESWSWATLPEVNSRFASPRMSRVSGASFHWLEWSTCSALTNFISATTLWSSFCTERPVRFRTITAKPIRWSFRFRRRGSG